MTADPEPISDDSVRRRSGASIGIRLAKLVISIVVVVGLCLAGKTAIKQWQTETGKIESQIEALGRELSVADGPLRESILNEQAVLRSALPYPRNLRWSRMAMAAVLYAIGLLPSAMLLRRAVLSFGGRPRWSTAIAAQTIGHVGKYVPGKAMVLVLRGGVLARDGVKPMTSTISVFLETFLMMAVGAVVAAIATAGLPVPTWITIAAVAMGVAAGGPTLPPILRFVAAKVTKVDPATLAADIDWRLFFAGWAWSLLSWLFIGASFTVLITAVPSADPLPPIMTLYPIATAAISLAMVIGFASLLPGGAGVRELVLTTVLGIAIGTAHGLLAAIAARLMFIAVEAVLAGLCWVYLRRKPSRFETVV
ncbi:MAG: lysylphosphatidylglycerol synthase domain-containing protein [Rubripirellula sp.]